MFPAINDLLAPAYYDGPNSGVHTVFCCVCVCLIKKVYCKL